MGDNLEAELVPFSFKHKDGGHVIKSAPFACIPNLWNKVCVLLNHHRGQRVSEPVALEQRSIVMPNVFYLSSHFQLKDIFLCDGSSGETFA